MTIYSKKKHTHTQTFATKTKTTTFTADAGTLHTARGGHNINPSLAAPEGDYLAVCLHRVVSSHVRTGLAERTRTEKPDMLIDCVAEVAAVHQHCCAQHYAYDTMCACIYCSICCKCFAVCTHNYIPCVFESKTPRPLR